MSRRRDIEGNASEKRACRCVEDRRRGSSCLQTTQSQDDFSNELQRH